MKGQNRRTAKMSCEWVMLHLDAYLDGELNNKQSDAVKAHLDSCPDCAAQRNELRELLDLVAACDDLEPDATLHESIMRSVREQPRTSAASTAARPWWRIGGALAGVCLLLLLALLPGSLFKANAPQEPAQPDASAPNAAPDADEDPESPEYDFSGDDVFVPSAPGKPEDSKDDNSDTPNESEPNGEMDSILTGVIVLDRMKQEGAGTESDGATEELSPLMQLDGVWQCDVLNLVIVASTREAYLTIGQTGYTADISVSNNQLLLQLENGERLIFEVEMEGDRLWLERLP